MKKNRKSGKSVLFDRQMCLKVEADDEFLFVGASLADDTYAVGGFQRVHEMRLDLLIRRSDRTIVTVEAAMDSHPHGFCVLVIPTLKRLEGVRISAGFTRQVKERLGGTESCNHLATLALQAGTAASLAFAGELSLNAGPPLPTGYDGFYADVLSRYPSVENTCHVWRSDGELMERLAKVMSAPPGTED